MLQIERKFLKVKRVSDKKQQNIICVIAKLLDRIDICLAKKLTWTEKMSSKTNALKLAALSLFRTDHSNNNPQITTQHKLVGLICSNT